MVDWSIHLIESQSHMGCSERSLLLVNSNVLSTRTVLSALSDL